MSTPMPPNCKLEGLELYAPRRARNQLPEGEDSPPVAAANEETDVEERNSRERDLDAALDSAQTANARLDDAIQAAVNLGHPARDPEPAAQPARLPPTANLRSPQDDADGSPSSLVPSRADVERAQYASLRSRLDPEIVPEPVGMERRFDYAMLVRFALAVGVAAIVAYGVVLVSLSQPEAPPSERIGGAAAAVAPTSRDDSATPRPQARLVVKDQDAIANEPLSLGLYVERATGQESVLLAGLHAGTWLSAGAPMSDSSWQLPSHDLGNLYVYPPKDFVGAMDTAIDLLSPNAQLLDSRAVRLEWTAKKSEPLKPAVRVLPPQRPRTAPMQPMEKEQAALLMQRGRELLKIGDIASARLTFRRLADSGDADAALALAMTFDPRYLAQSNVIGIVGDKAEAQAWYKRAIELGSPEAKRVLAEMTAN